MSFQAELHEKEQVILNHQRRRAIKVYKNLEKIRTRMNDDDQVGEKLACLIVKAN